LIGEDETWIFNEVSEPDKVLRGLLGIYLKGLTEPLPFFPRAAFAYMIKPQKGKRSPEELALDEWEGGEYDEYQEPEKEDPYFDLCFRNNPDPLGSAFQELARQIVSPILAHQVKEEE